MLRKLVKIGGFSAIFVLLGFFSLLVVSPFYLYEVFNQELPVARIEFSQLGEMEYQASVFTGESCIEHSYMIYGDQFQLDAGFAKWKGAAVMLGFRPRYRLDRLSGRYSNAEQQNTLETLSHDLSPDLFLDFFSDTQLNNEDNWLVDTTFGSSVYSEINPLLNYTVYATEDALILRESPIVVYAENTGNLMIDINQSCENNATLIRDLLMAVNRQ